MTGRSDTSESAEGAQYSSLTREVRQRGESADALGAGSTVRTLETWPTPCGLNWLQASPR